jgi:hypothetical protein
MAYIIIKKGRKPAIKPKIETQTTSLFNSKELNEKCSIVMMITNSILGIKDEIVIAYNEDISNCFRSAGIASIRILRINIAVTSPMVNVQNNIFIMLMNPEESKNLVMDCNQ